MVKIMENPIKMDDLGKTHYFRKHPYVDSEYEPLRYCSILMVVQPQLSCLCYPVMSKFHTRFLSLFNVVDVLFVCLAHVQQVLNYSF